MKVLVTGGGGFLGSAIVRRLLARGDEVVALNRSAYPELEALSVKCVQGSVTDRAAVETAVSGCDSVFHVAARVGYWGPYEEYERTNVGGTTLLLEAAKAFGVKQFVLTSSPSVVIGTQDDLCGQDESIPYPSRYLSSYGPTKAEAERRVLQAASRDFGAAALRPHLIFGPGDPQIGPRLVERSHQGKLIQVGDGSNQVDVTYIDNVVDAHLLLHDALKSKQPAVLGQAYFLGQEEPVRLWDFISKVLDGFGAPPVKRSLPYSVAYSLGAAVEFGSRLVGRKEEPPLTRMAAFMLGQNHYFSHAKAARDFGYVPKVSLEEGLSRWFAASETPVRKPAAVSASAVPSP